MKHEDAVRYVRRRTDIQPKHALILGSGLGGLADAVEDAVAISTTDLAGYPPSTVEGHRGRLVIGRVEGAPVLVVQGRVHLYEGHSAFDAAYPVRLAHALGARRLIVTNAAGGIHDACRPGTLMFITDHLKFAGRSPLVGTAYMTGGARRSDVYDGEWIDRAEREALRLGIRTVRGVYAWTSGPSYETRAEISAFRRLGADAVGMSTVPETLQAAALGMRVLGISTITNRAAGLSREPLSHQDVLRVGHAATRHLERLLRALLR